MKKNNRSDSYACMLGVTQQEMAELVGVTRGHWSMFDIGKRDLPRDAYEKLAQLLVGTNELKLQTKRSDTAKNQAVIRRKLQDLSAGNSIALGKLLKARDTLIKKREHQQSRQLLRQCLSTNNTTLEGRNVSLKATKGKATASDENYAVALTLLEYKVELLQFGQVLLEQKLVHLTSQ